MSETALRDLNTLPASDRKNESSSKGSFTKPYVGSANENVDVSLVSTHINGSETVNAVAETGNSEVEYIESENLNDVEDVDASLKVQGSLRVIYWLILFHIASAFIIYTLEHLISGDQLLMTSTNSLQMLVAGLDSKDWVVVCEALNNVRRLSIFHKESMFDML